jgi:hypothetical protein
VLASPALVPPPQAGATNTATARIFSNRTFLRTVAMVRDTMSNGDMMHPTGRGVAEGMYAPTRGRKATHARWVSTLFPAYGAVVLTAWLGACSSGSLTTRDGGSDPNVNQGGQAGQNQGGTGGLGGECVEMVLPLEGRADSSGGSLTIPGGVWRTEKGLHVGWKAFRAASDGGSTYKPWLFVATFDASNGTLTSVDRHDVLPNGITSSTGDIQAFAGNGMGFASSTRFYDSTAMRSANQGLVLGQIDEATHRFVDLRWDSGTGDVTDIAWDGEAYAVHSKSHSGEIVVTRVDGDGQVVLPHHVYGTTPSAGGMAMGYRVSTNPIAGTTFLLDAPAGLPGRFLSGHHRSGESFSWAMTTPLNVVIPELNVIDETFADYVGIAADEEGGAWTSWDQDTVDGKVARIVAHLDAAARSDRAVILQPTTLSTQNHSPDPAIVAVSGTRAWIAERVHQQILFHEVSLSAEPVRRVVLDNPRFDGTPSTFLAVVGMGGVAWKGEYWLWAVEHFTGAGSGDVLHVMQIAGACTYVPVQLR